MAKTVSLSTIPADIRPTYISGHDTDTNTTKTTLQDHKADAQVAEQQQRQPRLTMMNAVVHAGPHKTGTTTIQKLSQKIADHLVQDGYRMP
eukprot:CAMPEP_0204631682 /NCGR_PEP_ID=MMETSP0717-20131115/23240_1 /ASSEMBLY_ACC=CAM_ASM_000666 /TAXON_ID=230516 /ORGANISM="Chaetoceros curvisetus" /LENGTH=90 /DNA_ID=CAMNT_0051649305 /DNA_START=17 /DNA_END=285 /DNA_ORIENTATION=-